MERLQILVAHDRSGDGPYYLRQLQRNPIKLIRQYVVLDNGAVTVAAEEDGTRQLLELNIVPRDQRLAVSESSRVRLCRADRRRAQPIYSSKNRS